MAVLPSPPTSPHPPTFMQRERPFWIPAVTHHIKTKNIISPPVEKPLSQDILPCRGSSCLGQRRMHPGPLEGRMSSQALPPLMPVTEPEHRTKVASLSTRAPFSQQPVWDLGFRPTEKRQEEGKPKQSPRFQRSLSTLHHLFSNSLGEEGR